MLNDMMFSFQQYIYVQGLNPGMSKKSRQIFGLATELLDWRTSMDHNSAMTKKYSNLFKVKG